MNLFNHVMMVFWNILWHSRTAKTEIHMYIVSFLTLNCMLRALFSKFRMYIIATDSCK